MDFTNPQNLVNSTIQTVVGSLEVSNEEPIIGNTSTPSSTEIKKVLQNSLSKDMFVSRYKEIYKGDDNWEKIRMQK